MQPQPSQAETRQGHPAHQDSARPSGRRAVARNVVWVGWLVLLATGLLARSAPTQPAFSEYEVKAAFLHKFALFVEWPREAFATPNTPFLIAVLGEDPFGPNLSRAVSNKTAQGRPVVAQRFDDIESAIKAGCHMLFVASSEKTRLQDVLSAVDKLPILTVGDMPGCAEKGVMLNLLVQGRTLRFEVNRWAATQAGLKVSSQLLDLAVNVWNEPKTRRK